jgi:hypothetical protein
MKTQTDKMTLSALIFGACLVFAGLTPGYSLSQTLFYQGKTVTVIAATGVRIGAQSVGHVSYYRRAAFWLFLRTQGAQVYCRLQRARGGRGAAPR